MEKFVFMAGIKDVVEVAKIKEHSFMNKRDEIVEELPVYMDGKSLTWRYRLNYPNSREEGAYQEGITVDFKDMGETTENKKDFTNTLNIIVREPWFQGRLQEIRADAAWLEMDRDYEPSKMRNGVIERFIEDLNDITRRLNGVRRGFVERQKSVADLSVDSKPKVKDNVIKM